VSTREGPAAPKPPLKNLEAESRGDGASGLDSLLDVTLPVVVEFGRTQMTVQEVLQLGPGATFQLDRTVGDPVDILVSDRKLALGEVVVVGEYFGIRITKVLSHGPVQSGAR
jgi:flagellar motor switch protein FliN/FliY